MEGNTLGKYTVWQ
jgi:hypothetical protein